MAARNETIDHDVKEQQFHQGWVQYDRGPESRATNAASYIRCGARFSNQQGRSESMAYEAVIAAQMLDAQLHLGRVHLYPASAAWNICDEC
ncbi:hypothetical protein [Mesorhizobium escarrei]|uniref:RNase H type-1 domain-containing protein n=1 Tax=Mesorhizobium escarrei TaxID=666018 RepID=A0ABN8KHJ5_9HYPH|nr:hypothetical protein [Mesorhizobium escarrei]CAH2408275.1 hypothetical protein MES5069_670011 [Mesorhizobium escarrei]